MIKAVYFDLDGTLVDSLRDIHLCLCTVLGRLGLEKFSVDEVKAMIGAGSKKMVELALLKNGIIDSCAQLEEVYSDFINEYSKNPTLLTSVYPGGIEVLDNLSEQGIGLAVCTNKPRATTDPVIKKLKLQKYFSIVCCGDEIPFQKPDGRHISHILKLMKLNSNQAVMIGDSKTDVEAANNSGVRSITVSYGYDDDVLNYPKLDLVVDNLKQVPGAIDEILSK